MQKASWDFALKESQEVENVVLKEQKGDGRDIRKNLFPQALQQKLMYIIQRFS